MNDQIPCKNCITYAICRARMLPYLQGDRHITRRDVVVQYLQIIGNRCDLGTNYIIEKRRESREVFSIVAYETLKEMFYDR